MSSLSFESSMIASAICHGSLAGTKIPSILFLTKDEIPPTLVETMDDIDEFTEKLWNHLNVDNKVSLFVRFIDIATGDYETKIVNKNQ